ncbi:MAG: ABC transporter permease [Acidobacteria bacterium]|nr:ABC transporter permease [Acidobacteriota bacterium]
MTWLRVFIHRLRGMIFKRRLEREMEDEIRSHLEMQIEDDVRQGMSLDEARRAARRKFGGVDQVKEVYRDRRGLPLVESILQDLRYAARTLAKKPGFSLIAIITLALGIGANTAIFSVVNSILLRPLNYKESDRLVQIFHHYKKINQLVPLPASGYLHYRDNNKSFENIGASMEYAVNLTGSGSPERLNGRAVTHSFFPTLGVNAAIGRVFTPEENQPGRNRVAVLSDNLWQRRFNADPEIVGKSVTLSEENFTVVGILPPSFQFGREVGEAIDIYLPVTAAMARYDPGYWDDGPLFVIARLKQSVTLEQAQIEMDGFADYIRQQHIRGYTKDPGIWGIALRPMHEIMVGDIQPALLILMAAVGFVLLVACANVANLLLARAASRQKEMAIRIALGAGRRRVIRQLLTESALLALIGGMFGLLFASWGMHLLLSINEKFIPRANEVGVDGRVLAFTFGVSLLTGLLFGLVPALHSSRADLHLALKEGGRSGASQTRGWLRNALLVFEVTSTIVLLIGAGLLIKSFWRVQEVEPGFNPNNLLTMQLSLPNKKYRTPQQVDVFFQGILTELTALPGVKSAALSSTIPMSGVNSGSTFMIEGRTLASGENLPNGNLWFPGASYFQTMNIPLIRGRYFDDRDVADAASVAIIDETMARKYWPNEDPIGKRLRWWDRDSQGNFRWRQIVGIVASVRHHNLEIDSGAQFYIPLRQNPFPVSSAFLVIRAAASEPESLTAAVRSVIELADKELPVSRVTTMERMMADSIPQRRFTTILLGVFSLIALILASVGLFGVMSYTVAQRTHEIGIRMALGAQTLDVLKLIIRQGMTLVLTGVVIGLMAALGLTRLMKTMLFGVSETDHATFIVIPLLLAVVAMLACYLPARRGPPSSILAGSALPGSRGAVTATPCI